MEKEILGAIATVIGLFGYGIYIFGIIKGITKPHAFSWLVWGIINSIIFVIQVVENAGPGAWVMGASTLSCFIIAAMAYKVRSKNSITKGDWAALISSLLAIPLWLLTQNPVWSVILLTVIDSVAFYPSIRKGYVSPHEEMIFKYAINTLKHLLSVFALVSVTFSTAFFPLYLVVANGGFALMLFMRRKTKN